MNKVYLNNLGSFETGNLKQARNILFRGSNSFAGMVNQSSDRKTRGRVMKKTRGRVKKK